MSTFNDECRYCGGCGDWMEYSYSMNKDVRCVCHACGGKGYIEPEDEWWEMADVEWTDPPSL